eukprot:1211993-Amphidinium_carterae.1
MRMITAHQQLGRRERTFHDIAGDITSGRAAWKTDIPEPTQGLRSSAFLFPPQKVASKGLQLRLSPWRILLQYGDRLGRLEANIICDHDL